MLIVNIFKGIIFKQGFFPPTSEILIFFFFSFCNISLPVPNII